MANYYQIQNNVVTNTIVSNGDPLGLGVDTFLNTSSLSKGDEVADDGTITRKLKCNSSTTFISGSIKPTLKVTCNRNINPVNENIFSTNTGSIGSVTSGDNYFEVVVDTDYTGSIPVTITLSESNITTTDNKSYSLDSSYDIEVL